ncbi:hypothetical protein ACIQPQ_13220 [Streptomyces sp. NPDC091281]|uniref:hypothetical protein n=1 Tax=Streptomyces sp. NPDC091281 TaxID=3365985 RepID=UPI0038036314
MTAAEPRRSPTGFNLVPPPGWDVTRSYPADGSTLMTSVTYHWHTPPGLADVVLRGHHDDPEVIAAVLERLDDFARTLRLPEASGTAR